MAGLIGRIELTGTILLSRIPFLQQIASPANGGIAMTLLTRQVIPASRFEGNTVNYKPTSKATEPTAKLQSKHSHCETKPQ
jgi:hypothetical protein